MRQGVSRVITVAVTMALLAAACSGGSGDSPPDAVGEPTSSTGADGAQGDGDGGADTGAAPVVVDPADPPALAPVPATGDQLFPCSIGDLGTGPVTLAYAEADPARFGPTGDRFRAIVDDYTDRCGGAVTVQTISLLNLEACAEIGALAPALTVTDAASASVATCIGDATGTPVWHEAGLPTSLGLATDGLLLSTDLPSDVAARQMVDLLTQEGLLSTDSRVVVLHDETDQAQATAQGVLAALPTATAVVVDQADCAAAAASADEADVVIVVLAGACLAEVVAAGSGFPQWVVADYADALDDTTSGTSGAAVEYPASFDGATSYTALPANGSGWPLLLGPALLDEACNLYLDEQVGITTPYPGLSWSAGTRLCATATAVLGTLAAAADTEPQSLMDAAATLTNVPMPRGLAGSMTADEPWLAGAEMFALEWSADCECWNYASGPLTAG